MSYGQKKDRNIAHGKADITSSNGDIAPKLQR